MGIPRFGPGLILLVLLPLCDGLEAFQPGGPSVLPLRTDGKSVARICEPRKMDFSKQGSCPVALPLPGPRKPFVGELQRRGVGLTVGNLTTTSTIEQQTFDGTYKRGRLLGEGSFGKVLEARHRHSNNTFAVKIFDLTNLKLSRRKQVIESARNEVAMFCHLKGCPTTIQMHDSFEEGNFIYIVMDVLEGGDLGEMLANVSTSARRGTRTYRDGINCCELTEPMVARMIHQIIVVLIDMHKMGVASRDVKPDNFMFRTPLAPGGVFSIAGGDFGLSALFRHDNGTTAALCPLQSGTPSYAAFEVLNASDDRPYDPVRADLWSLAVTTFQLLFGYLPFNGDCVDELKKQTLNLEYAFPAYVKVSDEAKDSIRCGLRLDPEERLNLTALLEHPWLLKFHASDA